jgi:UPF0755 protein
MKKLSISLSILAIGGILIGMFFFFNSAVGGGPAENSFVVEQGQSIKSVARDLKQQNLVRSEAFFFLLTRITGKSRSIKSGHYDLRGDLRSTQILHILSRGIVSTRKFTIPEGFTMKQIGSYLEEKGITTAEEFHLACYNRDILTAYGIPFESAEGFLFPDTYIVAQDLRAEQLVRIMIEKFFANLKNLQESGINEAELRKLVIIASLVEKEAKVDDERGLIAAVFYNRLSRGKRLESCATVQYALGGTKKRLLYSDLRIDSPYNTYRHSGLPPGPIANPGFSSLSAALHPADVDYLFFVSKRDGSHYFSSTYQEHLKAIDRYNKSGTVAHQVS